MPRWKISRTICKGLYVVDILLDTHTFLWNGMASPSLSEKAEALIQNPANRKFLSIASPWELSIKISTGKFRLSEPVDIFFEEQMRLDDVHLLPIPLLHLTRVSALPFHHRDPFDRILIAQSLTEGIPLVSADAVFDAYGVTRFW